MQVVTDWESLSQLVREERRSGKRLHLAFPIEVTGMDSNRRLFVECTTTSDVSEAGCRFHLKTAVVRGEVVAIRLLARMNPDPDANRPLLFEIIWVGQDAEGWTAGVKKLQPAGIWHMHFPPKAPRRDS